VINQGDLRPMAHSREAMRELKDILRAREPFYRQAHLHLDTSEKSPDQSLKELTRMVELESSAPAVRRRATSDFGR
jgi:XRE family transcriptional regulator, aerobic/anaerobic benzoate catabolism transcriptional regulator